jgi:hypothetical protein
MGAEAHMRTEIRVAFVPLLMACLLAGCKGYITSPEPLITRANASYPFPAHAVIEAQTLNEDHVWERSEGKATLRLVDRSYRVVDPDERVPSSDTYLFKQVGRDLIIAQASNGQEWAYGLLVHADRYYLFTFNLDSQNCTNLSETDRSRFRITLKDDGCSVSSLKDLVGLLTYLRQKYPNPTSALSLQ